MDKRGLRLYICTHCGQKLRDKSARGRIENFKAPYAPRYYNFALTYLQQGSITKAARYEGVSRFTIQYALKKLNIPLIPLKGRKDCEPYILAYREETKKVLNKLISERDNEEPNNI